MVTNRRNHSTFRSLPTFTLVHHVLDDKRDGGRERKCMLVISMQQTEHCISTILMWWSRPGHRQTALSSSSLLCTHQGLCRDLQPTTVVRQQQMGRIRAWQIHVVHFLPTTGACEFTRKRKTMFYCDKYNVWVTGSWKHAVNAVFIKVSSHVIHISFKSKGCVGSGCDLAITRGTMCKCTLYCTSQWNICHV